MITNIHLKIFKAVKVKGKSESVLVADLGDREASEELRIPQFLDNSLADGGEFLSIYVLYINISKHS
jgi:hypothetical protein